MRMTELDVRLQCLRLAIPDDQALTWDVDAILSRADRYYRFVTDNGTTAARPTAANIVKKRTRTRT